MLPWKSRSEMERMSGTPLVFFLLCFVSVLAVLNLSVAQTPIPSKYDGFVYGGGSLWKGLVIIDAFLDPMCPDSRDSWPPLKQTLDSYHPRVSLAVHPFSLPKGKRRESEMERRSGMPLVFFLLCFFSVLAVINLSMAQIPIPSKYDGFVYGGGSLWKGLVIIDAFLDPMCPYSRDSWPPLKQTLDSYYPRVSLAVHPFSLPYHSNSFASCRALHIANNLNASSTYPLLELFFKNQESYYNAPTYHKSRAFITHKFSKIAEEAVGKGSYPAIKAGYNNSQSDMATRISFKYGCSRGVMGTPYFFVNGIPLLDYGSALNFNKWKNIIDPLLTEKN